ncbi:MAG: PAS domain-containing protein [Prochloraceae cyanobacterium]
MNLSDNISQEYLIVDRAFFILEKSLDVERFSEGSNQFKLGEDVRHGLPELIGLEEILENIFLKQKLSFELEDICRNCAIDKAIYFNLYFILENDGKLIILFEDVTAKNFKYQQKIQAANECKLLADRISENLSNLEEIVSSTETVLLITDRFGKINNVSPATLKLFGYAREELLNRHIAILFNNDRLIFFNSIVRENLEILCQTKTKQKLYLNFSSLSIYLQTDNSPDLIFVGQPIT